MGLARDCWTFGECKQATGLRARVLVGKSRWEAESEMASLANATVTGLG